VPSRSTTSGNYSAKNRGNLKWREIPAGRSFDKGQGLKTPKKPSFTQDIYPLLTRAINVNWVSEMATAKHAHATLRAVIPPPGSKSARSAIFNKLRDPGLPPNQDSGESDMPMIWSDYYTAGKNQPLTHIQYQHIKTIESRLSHLPCQSRSLRAALSSSIRVQVWLK
jgi:hypothetical protein